MIIMSITVSGVTTVDFRDINGGWPANKYVWIKNRSSGAVYASTSSDVAEGANGTTEIPSGEAGMILMGSNSMIYISGDGKVEIKASDFAECPFKVQGKGGDETIVHYMGITTTELYEGATANPILINGVETRAENAYWAVYNSIDYIFNGTIWQEFMDMTKYYTKTETDTLLRAKANVSDVYAKTDTYSKTETDTLLSAKANVSDVYAKTDTYSKTQANDNFISKMDVSFNYEATTSEINAAITDIWGA